MGSTRWSWLTGILLVGCGAEPPPPLEELPLRDSLNADPLVVASLYEEARLELALRFEEAEAELPREVLLPGKEGPWPEADVQAADALLDEHGQDALVVARLRPDEEGTVVDTFPLDREGTATLPEMEGKLAEDTAELEARALAGPAGATLAEVVGDTGATRLVRVEKWPVAVLARGDTVIVNGSWLVAMSALTPEAPVMPLSGAPGAEPQSVTFNPYDLPRDLAQCSASLLDRCECFSSGGCSDAEPVDSSFGSMNEECTFIAGDDFNASALCILALLSLDAIAECMEHAPEICVATDIPSAVAFAMVPECVDALDGCIHGRRPTPPSSTCDSDCQRNCIDLDSCDSDCNQSCSDQCDQTCDNTCNDNQSCNSCNDSSSDSCGGSSSDCDSGNCLDCSVQGRRRVTHSEAFIWLLLPIFWALYRTRRTA